MKTRPRRRIWFRSAEAPAARAGDAVGTTSIVADAAGIDISPTDPIISFFQTATGAVELESLDLDSPALRALKASGVTLSIPLISQGELIGVLHLGPRLSEQLYSADDRKLLENLARQAAPALRVAQLVRDQESEIRMRERFEQEMQIAKLIQQNFLPKASPEVNGWHLSAFYRPAREVGGDFYDFIDLPDGRIGIVVGDVTDKGVPAALVMASTRSVIRGSAKRGAPPGQVLERANELLCPEMPAKMFVTCLYAILDPVSGRLHFANAGHTLPVRGGGGGVTELRARGMPLGLLPGMTYEEKEVVLRAGETVLFTSDGIAEGHAPGGEMFGTPRLMDVVDRMPDGCQVMDAVLDELHRFTGPGWEQEDDITMVALQRTSDGGEIMATDDSAEGRLLADLTVPSAPGNERLAMARVAEVVEGTDFPLTRLEKLKTAVAEATMNAIEHGNQNRPDLEVRIRVLRTARSLVVRVTDLGGDREAPEPQIPNLEAKLAGEQSPRGWGLFLIKNMVDELNVSSDGVYHTIELVLHIEGGNDGI